jgi:hypothetical protein
VLLAADRVLGGMGCLSIATGSPHGSAVGHTSHVITVTKRSLAFLARADRDKRRSLGMGLLAGESLRTRASFADPLRYSRALVDERATNRQRWNEN